AGDGGVGRADLLKAVARRERHRNDAARAARGHGVVADGAAERALLPGEGGVAELAFGAGSAAGGEHAEGGEGGDDEKGDDAHAGGHSESRTSDGSRAFRGLRRAATTRAMTIASRLT